MKKIKNILFVLTMVVFFFTSCEEEYEIEDPVARFQIENRTTFEEKIAEPYAATAGDQLLFLPVDYLTDADYYVIWTGDEGHDYDSYLDSTAATHPADTLFIPKDSGVPVTSNAGYSYEYSNSGTYTITWIATNHSGFGDNTKSAILQKEITIVEP
ncbi:MAG: hypothetical protein GVY19_13480 [Bacteroidetes bacterium]|jgi:hypothetical protein|nr:hypothetical protein [Bacteroidota bacterium]